MVKDGGPAFPNYNVVMTKEGQGMTLRDYFAAKAMQGILASYPKWTHNGEQVEPEELARIAYVSADAMLKTREATP